MKTVWSEPLPIRGDDQGLVGGSAPLAGPRRCPRAVRQAS